MRHETLSLFLSLSPSKGGSHALAGVYEPTPCLARALHLNNESRSIEMQQWRIVKHGAG